MRDKSCFFYRTVIRSFFTKINSLVIIINATNSRTNKREDGHNDDGEDERVFLDIPIGGKKSNPSSSLSSSSTSKKHQQQKRRRGGHAEEKRDNASKSVAKGLFFLPGHSAREGRKVCETREIVSNHPSRRR